MYTSAAHNTRAASSPAGGVVIDVDEDGRGGVPSFRIKTIAWLLLLLLGLGLLLWFVFGLDGCWMPLTAGPSRLEGR
jgi:hypothetical protein